MRNLKTVAYHETALKPECLPITATAWDTTNKTIICAFGPTPTQPIIELKRRQPYQGDCRESFIDITSWDAPCPLPELECDEIVLLQHFADTATSCLVLAGGDVVVVREDPSLDHEKIEIVGSVDVGICAAAWAPDEELLAIVTRADTLVLMSRTFEPLNEATFSAEDLKASKHVSVGWGKKETQFQGKRAKAMRDPTMPERVDEGQPSPYEIGKTTASWRGDGQFVAINSVVPGHRRVIRVFSREAVLDSASEPVDGLEAAMSWRPSGNLIAGVKRSDDKIEVVFFERNGLRHGQFDLRTTRNEMDSWASAISLAWNTDSSVLAISFRDRVQFWTVDNYRYSLKQETPLYSSLGRSPLRWHPETPLRTVFTASDYVLDLTFHSMVARGSTTPPLDHGIVAVIDGKTLGLTPFRQAGVPPPMSFCEEQFGLNIIDCAVSQDGQHLAVLTADTVELCQWTVRNDQRKKGTGGITFSTNITKYSIPLPMVEAPVKTKLRYTQVVLQGKELYLLAPAQSSSNSIVRRLVWHDDVTSTSFEESPVEPHDVPDYGSNLLVDSSYNFTFCIDATTKAAHHVGNASRKRIDVLREVHPNSSIFILSQGEDRALDGQLNGHTPKFHHISLSPQGLLCVDQNPLVRDCTSYILTDAHIIFTTTQHLLKFVHLTGPSNLQVPSDTPGVDERCRSVERGSKIVTVIPSIYALILQMPRGNLETIYPRLLVLSGIRQHVKQGDYLAAFLACQTHQVDLNILHDYNSETFLHDIPKFIDQLKKPGRIDEFLSKVKDEDVTETLYRDTLEGTPTNLDSPFKTADPKSTISKVNRIADAFISALSSKSSIYLQNIITTHVCKRPPDLDSALRLVSSLRKKSEPEADVAVSHLCFLTDANRLFDAALALYDLDLTLLVAQNAQRDPREYMPFLQSLQDLPEMRRRYTVDNHLKRYAKALASLHALDSHDELQSYTVKHDLYTTAIDLYKYSPTHLTNITRLYADYLSSHSKHIAAATLFESLGDYNAAYPLYALAHRWREALTCATLIPLDTDKLSSLATSLATTCADENRDYRSAATIHLEYLSNVTTAARLLCKGSYFADAGRILALHGQTSQTTLVIDTGLSEKFGEILELVADCKTQLNSQIPRIAELRRKKEEDPLAFYGGDMSLMTADGVDIPDNISLAATDTSTIGGQSLFTRYGSNASKFGGTVASNVSRKTSKTKRREERKRARGKQGSVYEEEYLVASVRRLFERINGVHEEVKRLVSGLLRRGMRDQAAKVEDVLKDIIDQCSKARNEVWQIHDDPTLENTCEVDDHGRPSGADGVLWDSQQGTQNMKEAPEVKSWTSSGLMAS